MLPLMNTNENVFTLLEAFCL